MQLQERPNVNVRIFVVLGTISLLLFIALAAAAPAKEKEPAGQKVDNGSFGVFVNGRRVATETFSIVQSNNGSVANSQFKTEPGADPAAQSSQLELTGNGELRRYEWKELSPGKAQAVVLPNDNLLVERSTNNPQDKEKASIHGVERDLYRLNLKSEAGDWQLWLDDQFKLLRILVTADKTEVVRD